MQPGDDVNVSSHVNCFPLPIPASALVLSQNGADDFGGMDVGQTLLAGIVVEGEALKVQAEQMEQGSMEVGDGDDIHGRIVAELIGCAMSHAALDAAAGQPEAEAPLVVVAAVLALGEGR